MSIQRIVHGSTNGFQVRVGPRRASLTKFFAVRKHGGVRKALAAARIAEAELAKIALPVAKREGARQIAQVNNTSGLVGVRPRYTLFSDTPRLSFVVSWSKRGKAYSTSFSTDKHGLLAALTLAMRKREKATGVLYGVSPRTALGRMKHLITGA